MVLCLLPFVESRFWHGESSVEDGRGQGRKGEDDNAWEASFDSTVKLKEGRMK